MNYESLENYIEGRNRYYNLKNGISTEAESIQENNMNEESKVLIESFEKANNLNSVHNNPFKGETLKSSDITQTFEEGVRFFNYDSIKEQIPIMNAILKSSNNIMDSSFFCI